MRRLVAFALLGMGLSLFNCSSSSNNSGGTGGAGVQGGVPATGGTTAAGGQTGAPATGGTAGTAGAGGHGGATATSGATGGTPAKFSLTVKLTGFAPHVGQKIVAWVYVLPAKTKVSEGIIQSLPSANDSIVIPDILVLGASYQIDLWADLNGNGTCDPPPADHSWRLTADNITGDTTVEQVHDATTLVPVCGAAGNPTP